MIYVKFFESEGTGWWATVRVREMGAVAPDTRPVPPHGPWANLAKAREQMGDLINLSHSGVAVTVEPVVQPVCQRESAEEAPGG